MLSRKKIVGPNCNSKRTSNAAWPVYPGDKCLEFLVAEKMAINFRRYFILPPLVLVPQPSSIFNGIKVTSRELKPCCITDYTIALHLSFLIVFNKPLGTLVPHCLVFHC